MISYIRNQQETNMIDKIRDKAMHYWTDHKEMVIVVAVVLVIAIIT